MSCYEKLNETQQFAARVIADHARSTAFAIADGILPGNEGRNYVLRKIMRRAIYHGREHLGLKDLFFYKVCDFVVDQMHDAYPELETQRDFIGKMVRLEEERFANTLIVGLDKLETLIDVELIAEELKKSDNRFLKLTEVAPIPATKLAQLYDTFGTPIDLMFVILSEHGRSISAGEKDYQVAKLDEEAFRKIIDAELKSLQRASGIGKTERKSELSAKYKNLADEHPATVFLGYETTEVDDAKVLAIFNGDAIVSALNEDEEGEVVLDKTPFYAEAGGQVGDAGHLYTNHGAVARVLDTFSPGGRTIHKVKMEKGSINIYPTGDEWGHDPTGELTKRKVREFADAVENADVIRAVVDVERRNATRRNHTATHLVHAALKEVLGSHVKQAGSVVAPSYLRFDFTHYQPMTAAEIGEVEDLVNRYILQNEPVTTNMMKLEDAMRSGAVAMFGEKYGGEVRVLSVGGGEFSKELCGGTHVRATGDIGSFKITSDEAIASGVRRIRAITGFDAFERFREDEKLIDASLSALKTQRDNLPNAIERLQEEVKRIRREMDDLKLKIATGGGASANGDEAKEIGGIKVVAKIVEGLDANGTRQLSDTLLARLKSGVVVLGRTGDGKVGIIVRVSEDLTGKVKAGEVIREIAPIVGGKGGGKPDMAEGGGTEPAKLGDAIDASYSVIEKMLG